MTSIYLSPLLAGSRARSCGRAGGEREEEQGGREGSTEARLPGGEGAPSGPAAPHSTAHAAAAPHTQIGPRTPPGAAAPARAEPGLQRPPARPRGGGGGPRARQLPQSGPRHLRLAAPGRPPPTPAARWPPDRGRRPGSVSRYLHEGLYRAFGRVQVGGAQMAALVHRGRRVYQEQ